MTTAAAICSDHHRHRQTILPPRKLLLNLADDDDMAPPFAHFHKHRNNVEISLAHFHKHLPCNNTTEDEISLTHFHKHLPCNNEDEISYRTEACKDGKGCKRKVCFFAHSPRQLRLLPPEKTTARNSGKVSHHRHHCCGGGSGSSAASSPTSTLIGLSHLSPPLCPSFSSSPPLSPVSSRHPIHRPSKFQSRFTSYKDVLAELMSSLEAMNFSEQAAAAMVAAAATAAASSPTSAGGPVNFNGGVSYGDDNSNYQKFVMSPSTPNYYANPFTNSDYFSPKINGGERRRFGSFNERVVEMNSGDQNDVGLGGNAGGSESDPDLGWVNELLM
ncbi:Zinc finger CCCH domain-containing protein 2 [Linum perenne]